MITIRRLTPALLESYLEYFDHRAFTDNPDWSFCYCAMFYADLSGQPWHTRTAAQNRAEVTDRITHRSMDGFLAFDGDRAVGWCGAAPMAVVPAFADDAVPDKDDVAVIMCFSIAPDYRRRGIARSLLRAACTSFAEQGLSIVEANPRPGAATDAQHHFGPLELYLSEGFVHDRDDPEDGSVYVRKQLDPVQKGTGSV